MFKRKKKDYFDFPPNYGYLGKLDQPVAQCPADKNIAECSLVKQLRNKQTELKEIKDEYNSIRVGYKVSKILCDLQTSHLRTPFGNDNYTLRMLSLDVTRSAITAKTAKEISESFLQYVDELERADELNKKIDQLKNEINNLKEQLGIM